MIDLLEDAIGVKIFEAARVRLPGDYRGPWLDRPYGVLSYVVEGGSRLCFQDGAPDVVRAAGDACYIAAGRPRRSWGLGGSALTIDCVFIRFSLFNSFDLTRLFETPPLFDRKTSARVGAAVHEMTGLVGEADSVIVAARRKALGFDLLGLTLATARRKSGAEEMMNNLRRLAPVIKTINENFRADLPIGDLARMAHLSVSRFYRVFRAAVGASPLDYVRGLRLREAQKLLSLTDMTLAEIADAVGYRDPFHFSRTFKAAVGSAPGRYRRDRNEQGV